jgi:hypothetical protein
MTQDTTSFIPEKHPKPETRNPETQNCESAAALEPCAAEQRHLIPSDSFFLFLPWLFGKTIFSESRSGQQSILPDIKVSLWILKRLATASMNESMDGRN